MEILWYFSSSHPTPVLQMRTGMAHVSGARRMLANGGGSSSGMNSPTSSSRQPLPGADKSEGLMLQLGKLGHWSAGSLSNQRGGLPASGGLLGLLSAPARRPGGGVDLPCHGGHPSASFLRLPLPRDLGWAPHAPVTRSRRSAASSSSYSWKAAQLGAVLRGSGGRSRAPLSSGRVVLQPEWVSAPPFGGGRLEWCDWKAPWATERDHGASSSARGRYPEAALVGGLG